MRKSLQKMPPSGLSSKLASLPAALVAVAGARRHAPKPASANRGPLVAVAVDEDEPLRARLRLLEGFVSRTAVADCAHFALQWLADVLGLHSSICLVKPAHGEQELLGVGAYGIAGTAVSSFSVSLE